MSRIESELKFLSGFTWFYLDVTITLDISSRFGRRVPLLIYLAVGGILCITAGSITTRTNGMPLILETLCTIKIFIAITTTTTTAAIIFQHSPATVCAGFLPF